MEETLPVEEQTQGLPADETLPEAPAAEAPEPGETPEPVEEPGAKPAEKPDSVQRRIDKLTRARHDAERAAEYWRGKAEGGAVKPSDTAPEAEAKPKQEAYQSYEEYLEALTDWKLSERLQTERTRMHQESQAQTVAQGFDQQVKSAREKHADFDAVVYNEDLRISETMRDAMIHTENGAALAYHLGTHPEEAARIANLPPMVQVMAMGRLQAKIEAKAAPAAAAPVPSNAPAPITPVKASAPATTGIRDELPIGDWMKRRNAELASKRR